MNDLEFLSPRDDLFGVGKSALYGFTGQMRRILWEHDEVPLFSDFVSQSFIRMLDDNSVDATSLVLNSVPAFNVMVEKFANSRTSESVLATQTLANQLINEIKSKRRASVETQPIVTSTTVEKV